MNIMHMPGYYSVCLMAFASLLTGCAQPQFHAKNLPQRYAARPVRDFSTVDLARYAQTTAPNRETILPGDRLTVRLDDGTLGKDSLHTWTVSVDRNGQSSLPNIGSVHVAGLSRSEAEKQIVQASLERDIFLTPSVEIGVEDRPERLVFVTGSVRNPGPVKISQDQVSLADVIVRAGGITETASGVVSVSGSEMPPGMHSIEPDSMHAISDTRVRPITLSLDESSPSEFGSVMLSEGALVNVESVAPKFVRVMGVIPDKSIDVPAGQNLRILDALALAGGQSYSNWISDRLTITRRDPVSGNTIQIRASIRAAQRDTAENLLLAADDVINVDENLLTFTLSTISGFLGAGFNASRIAM
ncbi:MAG: polysaccharide biosynthesis/export family protein [Planctomycetaceae bacterium]